MAKRQRNYRIYSTLIEWPCFFHTLIKSYLACEKHQCPLLPTQPRISHRMMHYEIFVWSWRMRVLPSPGMILSETVFPASLIRLTMSECDLFVMEQPFTARIRSPTFSFPQRSAGLPSMMRPILWGIATQEFPAFCISCVCVLFFPC